MLGPQPVEQAQLRADAARPDPVVLLGEAVARGRGVEFGEHVLIAAGRLEAQVFRHLEAAASRQGAQLRPVLLAAAVDAREADRKSTRLTPVPHAPLLCR